jgi:pimeloyl-ACP methyl ester carboxylesterase
MKTPQDRYIKVGTINTRYWAEGGQGSTVILIHGLGGYVETWLPSFEVLAAQHRVYAVDLLGHGRTDKPLNVSYKIEDLAQFVRNFMAELEIEHAHVVGHSLGGWIGTRIALRYPEVVEKLVLVASAGLGKESSFFLRMISVPILGEMLTRPSRSGSMDFFKLIVHDPALIPDELIDLDYQMTLMPYSQAAFLKAVRAVGNLLGQKKSEYGPNLEGLPSITKPVLVIWGRQDPVVPLAHLEVAAKSLPNVQLQVLENCGHLPMFEQGHALNDLLLEFLSN